MDELITIVIIAAAIIFKVVGKKIGSARGDEVFPTIPVDPDLRGDLDKDDENEVFHDPFLRDEPVIDEMVIEEAERAVPVKPETPVKPVEVKVKTPILEEEQPKAKEKIEKKKLIVYSEIMKPKYLE